MTDEPATTPVDRATALVVVDVQNDFCEGGSLAVEGGAAVARSVSEFARVQRFAAVVATRDWHVDPGDHWVGEGQEPNWSTTWPVHCRAETHGAAFHEDLDVAFDEVFSKGRHAACYSGFEGHADSDGRSLETWLNDHQIGRVVVVGLATDHCVRATALDARRAGFDVEVLLAHCAGVAAASTERAVTELRTSGVRVV